MILNPVQVKVNDLLYLKKQVLNSELKSINHQSYLGWGRAKSPFKSKGLDFQEVRAYQPGDDIRQIDWRVTAKYGKPFTKLYTDEKERQVFLICDMRTRMKFASRGVFKSVACACASALLAFLSGNKLDRLGFTLLTSKHVETVKAYAINDVLDGFLRLLEAASNPTETLVDTVMLSEGLEAAAPLIRAGSLVFVLSDFSDWSESCEKIVRQWSQKSVCNLIHIYDIFETQLPSGIFPVSDGMRTTVIDTQSSHFQTNYANMFSKRVKQLKNAVNAGEIGYLPIGTDENIIAKVFSYCVGEKNDA